MKVILLENITKIGSIGEVIEVKRGFARNFLIANKKDLEKKKDAKNISEKLKLKKYTVKKLSTENNELYGSVKPTEISKIILDNDKIEIKPSLIQLTNDIKSLGEFKVLINLHSEVQVQIIIKVVAAETIQ